MEKKEYEKIIEAICEELKEKKLQVGSRLLTERELARKYEVGRYSVREAIRVMESMGLVVSRQGSGTYISEKFDQNIARQVELMLAVERVDLLQVNQVRKALEVEAYRSARQNMTQERLQELEELLDKEDWGKEKDDLFHKKIWEASENPLLVKLMEGLEKNCQKETQLIHLFADEAAKQSLYLCHRKILQGLSDRTKEGDVTPVLEHYELAEEECKRILSNNRPAPIQSGR